MVILSKACAILSSARSISTSAIRRSLPANPIPACEEFVQEHDVLKFIPIVKLMMYVVLPGFSAYAWHHEYEHLFLHKNRRPWPKYEFLNQKTCSIAFTDGEHTPMHHPYWNFTPKGYETDRDGNPLPKGVYAEE